ncbi:XRE family transcriptional regulator [Hwanghaeella grinnelliae]|uniref:XRE family transcriptional regulator n=1 Tax=Hwanghaeella grinnelliae TaxID=2500179 RepID=A0A3S2VQC6_9PROT|nr:XRE family transcriptional regulator [Hwanghaeella grinnelliae]RVU37775.1 XRE family transcriptional regulator [Hwanghaeella grinnelliae]
MEQQAFDDTDIDRRLAERLRGLRLERGWSLDDLATRSGISRATLSRLENAAVSATAMVLGKLCAVHGLTLSRLMHLVEQDFAPLVRRADQTEWTDNETGFTRRIVSPPSEALTGEALECRLEPGRTIAYDASPRPGMEHHLIMITGRLTVTVEGAAHHLSAGDCLRYRLDGASTFETPPESSAQYLLFIL